MTQVLCLLAQVAGPTQNAASAPWYRDPIAIGGLFIALFTIFKIITEFSNQRKLFIEGQNLKERDHIRHRLNNFFGPFKELRAESRLLYDVFALKLKAEAHKRDEYFRTLTYLAEGKTFSGSDQALLEEIIEVGSKQIDLIEKEGWAVSNPHLTELLGRLGAHIRLLALAHNSKLRGMSERLREMVYPLEVDGAIETETRKLRDHYEELRHPEKDKTAHVSRPHLDREESRTVSYYDKNALQYYNQTARTDLSDVCEVFRGQLPRGGLILDAGCGVGRDTRFFIKHGYRVVAFDASVEMVKLCRQYPFAYCLHCSFADIDFIEEFDGVWACASLVHLPQKRLREALLRLVVATKPDGVLYFSLKDGTGSQTDNDRTFFYYDEPTIDSLAQDLGLTRINTWKNESRLVEDSTQWTNYLYKKPRTVERVEGPNR